MILRLLASLRMTSVFALPKHQRELIYSIVIANTQYSQNIKKSMYNSIVIANAVEQSKQYGTRIISTLRRNLTMCKSKRSFWNHSKISRLRSKSEKANTLDSSAPSSLRMTSVFALPKHERELALLFCHCERPILSKYQEEYVLQYCHCERTILSKEQEEHV